MRNVKASASALIGLDDFLVHPRMFVLDHLHESVLIQQLIFWLILFNNLEEEKGYREESLLNGARASKQNTFIMLSGHCEPHSAR